MCLSYDSCYGWELPNDLEQKNTLTPHLMDPDICYILFKVILSESTITEQKKTITVSDERHLYYSGQHGNQPKYTCAPWC